MIGMIAKKRGITPKMAELFRLTIFVIINHNKSPWIFMNPYGSIIDLYNVCMYIYNYIYIYTYIINHIYILVGGLEQFVSIYWECHHPNWRTPSFFRVVGIPPTRWCSHSHDIPVIFPLMPFPWTPHQIIISQGRRRTTSDDVARSPSFTSPGSLQSTPAKSVGNSATRWSNTRGTAQLGLRWAMKS